jgi:hypothetical protein
MSTRHTARIILTALIAGVALLLSPATAGADYGSGNLGTPGAHTRTGNMATASVGYFGDSIGQRIATPLTTALAGKGVTLATDNQAGRATTQIVDQVLREPKLPKRVVIEAGSNDVFNPPVMAAQIKRLRAALEPKGISVLWVDVQVSRLKLSPAVQLADQRNSGWVNSQIRAGCTAPCVVIPWSTSLAAKPTRIVAYTGPDGVHPNQPGAAYMVAVVTPYVLAA